jgi:hypothetical protein
LCSLVSICFLDMFLFLKKFCSIKYVLLAFLILSCKCIQLHVYLFILHSVYWISCCPPADQILLKLSTPHRRLSGPGHVIFVAITHILLLNRCLLQIINPVVEVHTSSINIICRLMWKLFHSSTYLPMFEGLYLYYHHLQGQAGQEEWTWEWSCRKMRALRSFEIFDFIRPKKNAIWH